jgi:2,5-diamino-6-(ribosylamino)-4(3H)-pyrimidinone 5'-phosphate reductase
VNRPFVFINMAMTADGKIATGNRAISSFSSRRDQIHLLELRAQADAVMVGARTADAHPIYLGPGPLRFRRRRIASGRAEYNLRVLVSGSGSIHPEAAVFQRRFSPILLLTSDRITPTRLRRLKGLVDEVHICGETTVDFTEALAWLKDRWGVKRLLSEGGGELNDALFRARLVDELHLTLCPLVFGGRRAPTIAEGLGSPRLAEGTNLTLASRRRRGDELFLVYRVITS